MTLGLPTSMAGLVGAPVLRALKVRYPHIELSLIDGFSGHIHEWLVSGRIDMAILHDARHAPAIAVEPLSSEDLFLIGPKTPPAALVRGNETIIALRDIATLPLAIPGPDHGLRRQIDRVSAEAGVKLSVESNVDSLTVIKELINDGGIYTMSAHRLRVSGSACRHVARSAVLSIRRSLIRLFWRRRKTGLLRRRCAP